MALRRSCRGSSTANRRVTSQFHPLRGKALCAPRGPRTHACQCCAETGAATARCAGPAALVRLDVDLLRLLLIHARLPSRHKRRQSPHHCRESGHREPHLLAVRLLPIPHLRLPVPALLLAVVPARVPALRRLPVPAAAVPLLRLLPVAVLLLALLVAAAAVVRLLRLLGICADEVRRQLRSRFA